MRDYLTLDCTPIDEPCHGVGTNPIMENHEVRAYKEQLERILSAEFSQADLQVYVGIKKFPHDFGSYSEVVVYYDDDNEEAINQAFWLEANTPEQWDTKADAYLEAVNYTKPFPQLWSAPPTTNPLWVLSWKFYSTFSII